MTFVNAGLLWLLPLAAIPIVLHLLTLFRLRTVELSTFRFLFDSYLQQRRRMKFLEALLATLRTLFLLLLVLVFARPMVRHWNDLFQVGSGGREVILLVDCSASMEAKTAGQPAFARAKSAARAVVKHLQPEDRVTLIRLGARPEELFSRFSTDAAAISDKIDSLTSTPARANFYAAFMHLFGPEAPRKRVNPAVYLFTDCQSSGWNEVRNQGLERVLPGGTQLVVVNVGSNEEMPNQAVIGDPPPRRRLIVGMPTRLNARVANYARESAQVTLTAFVDGKEIARHKLSLKAGETVTRKVVYTPTQAASHKGYFKIEGSNADHFTDDDTYYFTLPVIPKVKVLVVNGNPNVDAELDETYFVRAVGDLFAKDPEEKTGSRPDKKPDDKLAELRDVARSLDLKVVPETAVSAETLKDAGVVILANCGGLNIQHYTLLRDFVAKGGGLLIFPGKKVEPVVAAYNTQFFPVPGVSGEYLTPVELGAPQGDPENEGTYDSLSGLDFSHPALAVFDDSRLKEPYFKNVSLYRRFPLTVPDKRVKEEKAKFWPMAELHSGGLALVESEHGDGRVIVAAFPINREWSNLPTEHGIEFVPLVLGLISRVQRRADLEVKPVVAPGDVVELSATGSWEPALARVTDPKGRTTPVALERTGARLLGAFERTTERGFYVVDVRPEQAEAALGATREFAVNLAAEESDFRTLGKEQFEELLPGTALTYVDASAEAQQIRNLGDLEEPIWRPLIYLMFVIIGVEFLLATLGGKRRRVDEGEPETDRVHEVSAGGGMGGMAVPARTQGE